MEKATNSSKHLPSKNKSVKTSTPNKDDTVNPTCSFMEISQIPGSSQIHCQSVTAGSSIGQARSMQGAKSKSRGTPLHTPGGNESRRQPVGSSNSRSGSKTKEAPLLTEHDIAYHNYLMAVAHKHLAHKQVDETKTQIEAQLNILSKRLIVDQLMLEKTRRQISDIDFRSDTHSTLLKMRETYNDVLAHMDGETAQNITNISSAVEAKLDHLDVRNLRCGTVELKKALEESNVILDKLRDTNEVNRSSKVVKAASQLDKISGTVHEVNIKLKQVSEKLPVLQGLAVEANLMKLYNADPVDQ